MSTTIKMRGAPRPWINAVVRTVLRTPGLRRLLGSTLAVITVTGAHTGRKYSTPVQVMEVDGLRVVLSQKKRTWWRNLWTRPRVELLVQGETIRCHASIADADRAQELLTDCLEQNPRVAKSYGIVSDGSGPIDPSAVAELLEHVVVIVISHDH